MENKAVAVILGGTIPHCEMILQLKKRGYYTILVDYLDNPPAKGIADEHIRESTLDQDAVLRISKERHAALVISACVDQANATCCYVAEKLGLPKPYSYETALNVTDKSRMKKIMYSAGIPTSRYMTVKTYEELQGTQLRYPLMVKPADSNSSNGIRKVCGAEELGRAFPLAKNASRNGNVIVEEYVQGREYNVYCIIRDHRAKVLMIAERLCVYDKEDQAQRCYATIAPASLSEETGKEMERMATRIATAFGLNNTPMFFQVIRAGDRLCVLEFAARVGGAVSFRTILENTGFDIISAAIDSYLGIDVDLHAWHKPKQLMAVNIIYGKNGIYSRITGEDAALRKGLIVALYSNKAPGAVLDNKRTSSNRIAHFIIRAEDEREMRDKIHEVYQELDVVNETGESILRRDITMDALWRPGAALRSASAKEGV